MVSVIDIFQPFFQTFSGFGGQKPPMRSIIIKVTLRKYSNIIYYIVQEEYLCPKLF